MPFAELTEDTRQDVEEIVVTSGGSVVRLSENVVVTLLVVSSSYWVNVGVGVHAIHESTGSLERADEGDGGGERKAICGLGSPSAPDDSSCARREVPKSRPHCYYRLLSRYDWHVDQKSKQIVHYE